MIPDKIYHYYERRRGPLRSMSELSADAFAELMDELAAVPTPENRFDEAWKREFYAFFRPYVEQTIRERFISKGGNPQLRAPRYFTLGPTRWFEDWYQETETLAIPLADVPDTAICRDMKRRIGSEPAS